MALLDFVKKKKDQLVGAYNNDASTLGVAKNTVLGLKDAARSMPSRAVGVAQRIPKVEDTRFFKGTTDFMSNLNTRPLSSRADSTLGKLAGGIVETPYTFLTSVPKTAATGFKMAASGDINTRQGLKKLGGMALESGLDTASVGLFGKANSLRKAGMAAVGSRVPAGTVTSLIKQGAKQGLKTGGVYGAGYGLSEGLKQDEDLKGIAKSTATGGATGALLGGVLGGGIPASSGLYKAAKHDLAVRRGKSFGKAESLPERNLYRDVATPREKEIGLNVMEKYMTLKPDTLDPNAPLVPRTLREIGTAMPRPGMSIEDVTRNSTQSGRRSSVALDSKMGTGSPVAMPQGNQRQSQSMSQSPIQAEALNSPDKKSVVASYPENIPSVGGNVKQRGFIESVKGVDEIAPEVAGGVSGTYTPTSNRQTFSEAKEAISSGFEDAVYRAKTDETIGRQANAEAVDLIGKLQASGRMQDAIDVVENLAKRGTEAGQSIQVLAAINKLSPDGVLMWAQRNIEKAKIENPERFGNLRLTPEKANVIRKMAEDLQSMTGDEKMKATLDLVDEIQKIVPSSWAQKLTTLWKAGLLTGVKGAIGGSSIGNTTNVIMRKLADVPAAAVDTVLAQITGNHSKVFTLKGLFSGAKEGVQEAAKNMKMGTGANDLGYKMDYKKVYFDTPAVQKYVDTVFNFYSAADRPFYHSALKNSLYDLSTVAGKNQGLKGKALKEFVEKTVKNPDDTILNRALEEAKAAVFQDKTAIGSGLSGMKQGLKKYGGAGGEIASEVVAPFTGVPSSIATAVHRYSPTGAAQGIYRAIVASSSGNFDQAAQRNLSEAIGKGLTGTGVLWLGAQLTNSGQMTLGYPTDPGERSLWEREGKMPYSIKIGGKWRSLNYTGHIMSLLAVGGEISRAMKEGAGNVAAVGQGILGSGKAILGSSPLQGAQAGMNAITDPQRYGDSYFRNFGASTVPTLVKDFASAGDRTSREVNNFSDAFKNKIPGMRNTLLPKRDVFGEVIENPAGPVSSIIDPLRSREAKSDPITDELRRLQDSGFGPTLSMPSETIKAFGEEVKMTPEELDAYEERTGTLARDAVSRLISSPQYQGLGDEQKKDLVDKTITDIRRAEKERIISGAALPGEQVANGTVKPSKAQKDLAIYNFMNSNDNSMEYDGKYYTKDDSTESGYRSKTLESKKKEETSKDVKLSKEKMQSYKADKDIDSWLKEADVLYKKYDKMLRAETDEVERLKIENDMKTLASQFSKYKSYGGYNKQKKAKKINIPSINDADFIVKKMSSRLRPLRAFGRSRTNLASVARPNIRRPKRLS